MPMYFAPLVFVIAALACGPAAEAATRMVVTSTTWLHAGPGQGSEVLGEVGTGIAVEVLGCQEGWCQVDYDHALGFVQQTLLAAAGPQSLGWQPGPDCFHAEHFTAEGPLALTICPNAAPAR